MLKLSFWIQLSVVSFILLKKIDQLEIFNTDLIGNEDRYCIPIYIHDNVTQNLNTTYYSFINFCQRINHTEYDDDALYFQSPSIHFDDLIKQNISIKQLTKWSSSIDVLEHYQMYLLNISNQTFIPRFYNCTRKYFGQFCQFYFYYGPEDTRFVEEIIFSRRAPYEDDDRGRYFLLNKIKSKSYYFRLGIS